MDTVNDCFNCRHVSLDGNLDPCRSCVEFHKWEPHPDDVTPAKEPLCEDEGCDHFGTPHVCRTAAPKAGTSDGGSTGYYKLPAGATDLQDLIEHKKMSFGRGNIFKAAYRLGEKDAATEEYDLRKIIWFAERRLKELRGAR